MLVTRKTFVLAAAVSSTLFVVACKKESPAPAPPAPVASASARPAGIKGSSGDTAAAAGSAKPADGPGAVVIATHALPDATKPVSGFKPKTSGFKFQNYGNEGWVTNMTPTEVRRMFGDEVCASLEGDHCTLTPPAQQWLEASNKAMGGGHCEGMAALALIIERGQIDPKLFGSEAVAQLDIKGNEKLQREIAYWFITQGVMPMAQAEDKTLTPTQVAEKLAASFKGGETYTLGFYAPGYKMGHATTPYAVIDKGDDVAWIMHYDNNYPGEEKHIEVNKKTNVWSYTTAADPAAEEHAYKGDADTKTLTIAPTSVRTGPLFCHFCGAVDGPAAAKGAAKGAPPVEMREIDLSGDADLLITDEGGKRLGYVAGKLVNEIPGAFFAADKSAADDAHEDEPLYYVPSGKKLKLVLDGAALDKASDAEVTLVGRGYTLGVEGVSLTKGQKDEIEIAGDWSHIAYSTKKAETPTLLIGINAAAADFEFDVKVSGETGGQKVDLAVDVQKGTFAVKVKGDAAAAKPMLDVVLTRIDKKKKEVFKHKSIALAADQIVVFDYAVWKGAKTPLHASMVDAKGAVVTQVDEAAELVRGRRWPGLQ